MPTTVTRFSRTCGGCEARGRAESRVVVREKLAYSGRLGSLPRVNAPANDVDWNAERCLSLTDVLIDGKLLELATTRARQSFAKRLAARLNENDDPTELADWIVEQPEVVELHASDEELQAAIEAVAADELDDKDDDAGEGATDADAESDDAP